MADITQSQQGFEPTALRQAFVEFVEKWAKEYGYEKQPRDEDEDENYSDFNITVDYIGTHGNFMYIYDQEDFILLELPYERLKSASGSSLVYSLSANFPDPPLFNFYSLNITGGEYGLQATLEVKKQIERRIKQIEKKG